MPYIARVSLFVVRHAHAGQRSAWAGDDSLRPLSAKGEKQALSIADALVLHQPERILSSPAVRCTTTVEPLAERLGLTVEADQRLREGGGDGDVRSLLQDVRTTGAVLCSHGEVIAQILRQLVDDGMEPEQGLRWSKASTWVVGQRAHGWGTGTYLPPPGV